MFNKELLTAAGGAFLTSPSGRKFWRHPSGMGAVMEFNDGQPRKVLVLDAQYRLVNKSVTPNGNMTELPEFHGHPSGKIWQYLHTKNQATNVTEAASITDAWINANVVRDSNSAKHNCDIWMNYNSSAVAYCRSISVSGVPCDLPNIQTLARIYCDAEAIDALDASPSSAAAGLLGSGNPAGGWKVNGESQFAGFVWSSTKYTASQTWLITFNGHVQPADNYFLSSIIPVLEL